MQLTLSLLAPNPYRDFHVDPIDEAAVEVLTKSITEDGFWGGVVVRWNDTEGIYEIAAGHHRIKAAIAAGITKADLFVGDIDDAGMIRIYARENASQRGNGSTAVAGTVASAVRYLTKELFSSPEFGRTKQCRQDIGSPAILTFLDGVPGVSKPCVENQLANLKASGDYARIVREVQQEVERDAAEAQRRMAEAAAEQERLRVKAEAEAAAAKRRAEEADAEAKRRKDAAAKAEAEAAKRRAEEAAVRAEEAARIRAEREEAMKAEAARFEAMKMKASKAADKAEEREVTFDFEGVAKHLKNENQVRVFREVVTGEGIKPFLPVDQQSALAESLVEEATRLNRELSGAFIRETVVALVLRFKEQHREMSKKEAERLRQADLMARAKYQMDNFSRSCRGMAAAGVHLAALMKDWPKELPFPVTGEFREALRLAKEVTDKLTKEV